LKIPIPIPIPIEGIILVNPRLKEDRVKKFVSMMDKKVIPPVDNIKRGVAKDVYDIYSLGLERACADVVITVRLPNGDNAVLAVKRAMNKPFGGKWWMQGGSFHPYRSIVDFLIEKAGKECGICPKIEALIGVFRTCAEDHICSTIQLCYVGRIDYDDLAKIKLDKDQTAYRILTMRDLETLPKKQKHWYPMLTFRLAIETM